MWAGALLRLGIEGQPFATIVASGPRTALPHGRSSRRSVAAGDWLLLDFGAQVDGYCADITRTVVVGARATERQRTLYALVEEAQRRARAGVRAGMAGREADALARDVIAARGFGDAFGHSFFFSSRRRHTRYNKALEELQSEPRRASADSNTSTASWRLWRAATV